MRVQKPGWRGHASAPRARQVKAGESRARLANAALQRMHQPARGGHAPPCHQRPHDATVRGATAEGRGSGSACAPTAARAEAKTLQCGRASHRGGRSGTRTEDGGASLYGLPAGELAALARQHGAVADAGALPDVADAGPVELGVVVVALGQVQRGGAGVGAPLQGARAAHCGREGGAHARAHGQSAATRQRAPSLRGGGWSCWWRHIMRGRPARRTWGRTWRSHAGDASTGLGRSEMLALPPSPNTRCNSPSLKRAGQVATVTLRRTWQSSDESTTDLEPSRCWHAQSRYLRSHARRQAVKPHVQRARLREIVGRPRQEPGTHSWHACTSRTTARGGRSPAGQRAGQDIVKKLTRRRRSPR